MSDLMLIGVLRMPITPQSDELTITQYISSGRQAADLIEQQAAEIEALRAHIDRLMGLFGDFENDPNDSRIGWKQETLDVLRATNEYVQRIKDCE